MPYDIIPEQQAAGVYGFLDDALLVRACFVAMGDDCAPSVAVLVRRTAKADAALRAALPQRLQQAIAANLKLAGTVLMQVQAETK
jgi:uncharacterized membrane protein YkvA (DUF1232 family)